MEIPSKDQATCFASHRLAAAAARGGGGRQHPHSSRHSSRCRHSSRSPASDPCGQPKAHGGRSGRAEGRGTPWWTRSVWKSQWFCNLSFRKNVPLPVSLVFFSDLGKFQVQVADLGPSHGHLSLLYIFLFKYRQPLCFYMETSFF